MIGAARGWLVARRGWRMTVDGWTTDGTHLPELLSVSSLSPLSHFGIHSFSAYLLSAIYGF